MQYLSNRAAKDFLWATRAAYSIGLASWTETLDRLVALRQMSSPTNPVAVFAERLIKLEDWPLESFWEDVDSPEPNTQSEGNLTASAIRRLKDQEPPDGEGDESPYLCYLVSSASGLSDWEFHQYDNDPYPSVPHGHRRSKPRWKLDAYQGWVYERTRQDHREPRWKIIALWNDWKFRQFAIAAIKYHAETFPHRNDWRVAKPMRLPTRK